VVHMLFRWNLVVRHRRRGLSAAAAGAEGAAARHHAFPVYECNSSTKRTRKLVSFGAAGVGYLPLLPAWKVLLPGIEPAPLTASVVFHTPLIRDLVSWAGFRQV